MNDQFPCSDARITRIKRAFLPVNLQFHGDSKMLPDQQVSQPRMLLNTLFYINGVLMSGNMYPFSFVAGITEMSLTVRVRQNLNLLSTPSQINFSAVVQLSVVRLSRPL